ncbi:hypothetical protein CTI12_AA078190 [Artemisia annua]|uniref:Uncharacterized protein n=1 Tax=Artemisia annua TaxID=35608 RepID=A0A2U1Q3Q8_ARTAN|nr:hypothetical protein CTI12_AA078190 [Artemisia annua]
MFVLPVEGVVIASGKQPTHASTCNFALSIGSRKIPRYQIVWRDVSTNVGRDIRIQELPRKSKNNCIRLSRNRSILLCKYLEFYSL